MDVRIAVPDEHVSKDILDAGLEMTTRVSEALMRDGAAPTFTEAVKRGVQWKPEPPGQERFDNARTVGARGWGDCDDLAPMRAAELRASGKDPRARAVAYKSGPGRWHAIVQRSDGKLEDPSRTAGMSVRQGSFAAGIPPAVVGMMGHHAAVGGGGVRPFVAVRRNESGYLARVDVPVEGENFAISCVQRGPTPSKALSGCMAGACMIGGVSEVCDTRQLDRMWALHGLMKGSPAREVCAVCGVEATQDALETLQQIAPDLVRELRKHWEDTRVLRADYESRRTARGGAVPFRDTSAAGAASEDWESRLGHGRAPTPYTERYGGRGRNFVGAATDSPYYEMVRQRQLWGVPRAFQSEQGAPTMRQTTMAGAATDSPYTERWRAAHPEGWGVRRAGVSPEAVMGAATMSPYMARWLADHGEGWGVRRAGVSPDAVDGALPFRPTLSFSLAGAGTHRRHHRAKRAKHIIHHVHFGAALDRALSAPVVVGWDLFKDVIQPAGDALSSLASGQVKSATGLTANLHVDLSKTLSDIGKGASTVLQAAQSVISLIPGIGTGISSAISAGLAMIQGGSPLDVAVKAAYGAIPIPPGLRQLTDIVVDAALSLAHTSNLADAAITAARKAVLDNLPGPAKDIGATVFDTLAHLVLGAVHNAPTHAAVAPSPLKGFPARVAVVNSPGQYAVLAQVAAEQARIKADAAAKSAAFMRAVQAAKAPPKRVIHLTAAARKVPALVPVHAMAPPPRPPATTAPLTLELVVRSFQPEVIRNLMVVPYGVRI